MAEQEPKGLALLWKTEDWLAVWVGFFVIIVILAGLTVKMPKFKWATDGEFASYSKETAPAVEKLAAAAGEKKDAALQADAAALKTAMDAGDRKGVGTAAKKFLETAKASADEGIKKKAEKLGKDISSQAGGVL